MSGRRIPGCPYEHWVRTGELAQGVPCSDKCAHWVEWHSARPMVMNPPCPTCHAMAKVEWARVRGESIAADAEVPL